VLGFSQGATLAASLVAQHTRQHLSNSNPVFQCAISICSIGLWDSCGEGRKLCASIDGEVITIPTAIIPGSKDQQREESIELSKMCNSQTREVFDHGGGHEVPRGAKVTAEMVRSISAVIDRALFVQ